MKHRFTALATLAFLAACGETPTEPMLMDVEPAFTLTPVTVANHSFESGITPIDWSYLDVDVVGSWQSADGTNSIDLNGFGPGFVSQDIATTPGTSYTVMFALAGNPGDPLHGDPQDLKRMSVSAALALGVYEFNTTGKSLTNMGWVEKSFTFTATDATTTLTFRSLHAGDPNNWRSRAEGPALDNIRVVWDAPDAPTNPETKADCKKGGWQDYGFRNQGQCIRYVNTGKDSR